MAKSTSGDYSVIVFDIRNFSSHRYLLGQVIGGGPLLTNLVKDLLNDAVKILKSMDKNFLHLRPHYLNHTGDGFVLVVRGPQSPLVTLLWISKFRDRATSRIGTYQEEMKRTYARIEKKLPCLDFGIGAHFGMVVDIEYESFGGRGAGVLGSSINVASRVEQCTKDHDSKVIFTGRLREKVMELIPEKRHKVLTKFWRSLGKHRLRGFDDRTYIFYDFKPNFHKAWARNAFANNVDDAKW